MNRNGKSTVALYIFCCITCKCIILRTPANRRSFDKSVVYAYHTVLYELHGVILHVLSSNFFRILIVFIMFYTNDSRRFACLY